MVYSVKEIFLTLQGEGYHSGRAAVFCRFSGCNLWSGREVDRAFAQCTFCDTDFIGTDGEGGGRFADSLSLANAIEACWGKREGTPYVVMTGGEPILQLDEELIKVLHQKRFELAVETNGSLAVPPGVDWVCVSPKAGVPLRQKHGDELKLVFPQEGVEPSGFSGLDFKHFWLQPLDGDEQQKNTHKAVAYCLDNPLWKLSLQTHKLIGIP